MGRRGFQDLGDLALAKTAGSRRGLDVCVQGSVSLNLEPYDRQGLMSQHRAWSVSFNKYIGTLWAKHC